jgi:hypothetical protein
MNDRQLIIPIDSFMLGEDTTARPSASRLEALRFSLHSRSISFNGDEDQIESI